MTFRHAKQWHVYVGVPWVLSWWLSNSLWYVCSHLLIFKVISSNECHPNSIVILDDVVDTASCRGKKLLRDVKSLLTTIISKCIVLPGSTSSYDCAHLHLLNFQCSISPFPEDASAQPCIQNPRNLLLARNHFPSKLGNSCFKHPHVLRTQSSPVFFNLRAESTNTWNYHLALHSKCSTVLILWLPYIIHFKSEKPKDVDTNLPKAQIKTKKKHTVLPPDRILK